MGRPVAQRATTSATLVDGRIIDASYLPAHRPVSSRPAAVAAVAAARDKPPRPPHGQDPFTDKTQTRLGRNQIG